MDLIVSDALSLLRVRNAALHARESGTGPLVCTTSAGGSEPDRWRGRTLAPGDGVAGRAVLEDRPMWSPDFLADPRVQVPEWLAERAMRANYRAVLVVPLKTQDEVIGVLGVGSRPWFGTTGPSNRSPILHSRGTGK